MATEERLKDKVSKGIFWGGLNTGVQQLLNFVIGVFLARILTPADYGMVGVLAVFSGVAGALQEGGFISALTNRKNVTEKDFCSVFWFSLSLGLSFYVILFFCAPFISKFYELPELTILSRFVFIGFVLSCLGIIPRAILFKNMRVKDTAKITMLSMTGSGIVGISLAFFGYAYWGLAWQSVSYIFLNMLFAYIYTGWLPRFEFSFQPIREMVGYSSKIVVTNVFNTLNGNIFAVLLGKFYTPQDVGDFNQANKWNGMGYSLIVGVMNGVAQPALTKVVDDKERQTQVFRKMLRFTAFVSFPLMFGLSLVATDFIVITIGEKWLMSAFVLQMLCVWGAFYPISHLFSNLLLSQGRSNVYMWNTIILALIQMFAVYVSYPYGLYTMLYVFIAINIVWVGVWYLTAKKYSPISFIDLLKDIVPFLMITGVAYFFTSFVLGGVENLYISFLTKIIVMSFFYLFLLWLLKAQVLKESVSYLMKSLKFVK